jgi:Lipocalin-like domain
MKHRAILVVLVTASVVISGVAQQRNADTSLERDSPHLQSQLIGTWRLISRVVTTADGIVVRDPGLGAAPMGYLIYDSSGHVAVQIMKTDRSSVIDCSLSTPAPSNNSQSVNGYDAYFGTYTIDEAHHTVTHHLEGALDATDVGKSLVRYFQVSADKLAIIVHTSSLQGEQIRTVNWERVH